MPFSFMLLAIAHAMRRASAARSAPLAAPVSPLRATHSASASIILRPILMFSGFAPSSTIPACGTLSKTSAPSSIGRARHPARYVPRSTGTRGSLLTSCWMWATVRCAALKMPRFAARWRFPSSFFTQSGACSMLIFPPPEGSGTRVPAAWTRAMNQTTNYFRANHPSEPHRAAYVFFDDRDFAATNKALADATALATPMGGHVSMFRPPLHEGPWDAAAQLVGHRRRVALLEALENRGPPKRTSNLRIELAALDAAFAARRASRPVVS